MNAKSGLRKRFLSLALSIVMLLGLFPTSTIPAFAISSDPLGEAKTPMDEVIEKNGGEKTFTVNLDKTIVDGGLITGQLLHLGLGSENLGAHHVLVELRSAILLLLAAGLDDTLDSHTREVLILHDDILIDILNRLFAVEDDIGIVGSMDILAGDSNGQNDDVRARPILMYHTAGQIDLIDALDVRLVCCDNVLFHSEFPP